MQDGKFHPHTDYKKGIRKSRDQKTKTEGVKIERKARTVSRTKRLPDVSIGNENFSFRVDDGEINLSLDDFGWRWSGEADSLNSFIVRMSGTGKQAWDKLVSGLEEAGITVEMLKPYLVKNLSGKLTENDDGLYQLSGDNVRWHFGDDFETDNALEGEVEHHLQQGELNKGEEDEFEKEFWNHFKSPTYEQWLEYEGSGYREELKKGINDAKNFEELEDVYTSLHDEIEEGYHEFFFNEAISPASWGAVEAIQTKRDEKGKRTANIGKEITSGKQSKLK